MNQENGILKTAKIVFRSCSLILLFVSLIYLGFLPKITVSDAFIVQYHHEILLAVAIVVLLLVAASAMITLLTANQKKEQYVCLLTESKAANNDIKRTFDSLNSHLNQIDTELTIELKLRTSTFELHTARIISYRKDIRNTYILFVEKYRASIGRLHGIAQTMLPVDNASKELFCEWEHTRIK